MTYGFVMDSTIMWGGYHYQPIILDIISFYNICIDYTLVSYSFSNKVVQIVGDWELSVCSHLAKEFLGQSFSQISPKRVSHVFCYFSHEKNKMSSVILKTVQSMTDDWH